MKKIYSLLITAIVMLAIPMGMNGQTRAAQTASYGFETGDAGWTATSFVTNNTAITAHGGSKYGATNGSSTANVAYNTIVANPQSLTCYYSKTTTNTNAGSHFEIQVSTNNSTWTTVESGLGMDKVTKGTWYELTADLSSYSNVYVRVYYTGTSAVRALDDITLTYDDGQSPSTDPEITFNPASIALGEVFVGNQVSTTFSVSQANLSSDITLSVDNGSLSPSSIAQGAAATTVTWTYTPTTAGTISATVTASSGETTETLAISGTAIAPVEGYDVDFEYATNMYPNWAFDNMTTYQTGSITAHGGTYYGTTGGKTTASITTASTVETPGTLTCYVSKQSGNTTSSTWYIQVSSDGSDWENVEEQSATSMSQGSWAKFSADLSSYTNVYVRVYYSGSTAIRNIDDLTLTIRSSVADPTFSPVSGTTFGNEGLTVTISQADNESIYYTVDGSTPDNNSTLYSQPITLTTSATINAIAYDGTNYSNVTTATYTYIDPNAPGTQNNPYTVAQAIANTPSDGNVYIRGIVSSFYNTSIVGDGSNYRYYISDNGTTTSQLLVYKGKGLNQATFSNANDLLVGDTVVICGALITYQNAPEVASGNYLTFWSRPVANVEAPTFSPVAGTYASAQTVSISCATTPADIYYTTDGSDPDANSTLYDGTALTISSTTTIKAIAYSAGANSNITTATFHINSQANPYTVAQALAFNEYPANGIYVHGIVSTAASSLSNGTLTYYISDDGTTTAELEVYKGKDLNNESFTNVDDIQVGDIVTVYGNVVIYGTSNPIKEFAQGNYLVSFERPQPVLEEYDLTVSTLNDHINAIYVFDVENQNDPLIEEGLAGTVQVLEGTDIMVSPDVEEGYVLASLTVLDSEGTSVQPEDHMSDGGYYSFTMPSGPVTINATAVEYVAPTGDNYELYTGDELVEGDYLIVYEGVAMNNVVSSGRLQYEEVTAVNGVITTDNAAIVWHIAPSGDYWTIYSADAEAYAAGTGVKNKAQMLTDGTDDKALWTITGTETYNFVNKANAASNVNAYLRNNKDANQNYGFACYASTTGGALSLYKKDESPVTETYELTIAGYGNDDNVKNGWNLIASPVSTTPDQVENMTSNTYDLYRFNQNTDLEWENYKNPQHQNGFTITPGQGYLYANSGDGTNNNTVTLIFSGEVYDGDGIITLENAGWNLIGNPFTDEATIDGDFYIMNEAGSEIILAGENQTTIAPMQGIFVQATEVGESVTFTHNGSKGKSAVELNLSQNRGGVIDRAIVRFGNDNTLPKFQLFENSTKLYIAQNGEELAIASAEEQGEMPVNFKAAANGTYTISINTENVEMGYLHLIDNLTGNDVDLLATPSYTFEANTADYASRFRLVFSAGNADSDNFAFVSNGQIVLTEQGNAQVYDITGRLVNSYNNVNHISTEGMTAGVYVIRLTNGNNTKTQRIVVK